MRGVSGMTPERRPRRRTVKRSGDQGRGQGDGVGTRVGVRVVEQGPGLGSGSWTGDPGWGKGLLFSGRASDAVLLPMTCCADTLHIAAPKDQTFT